MNINNLLKINKNKIPFFDYIRVTATIMLIITHSLMMDLGSNLNLSEIKLYFTKFISSTTISCNILFLLLSGALLLSSKKDENILEFYYKRFLKLLIPMLVYYLFYMYVTNQISFFPPKGFNIYLTNFLSGTVNEAPHIWILYKILAFYLICPFIKLFLKYINYKTLSILMIISYICITLNVLTNYVFNMGFIFTSPLNELFIIPIFGYFINLDESKKYYNKILILSLLALIIHALLTKYNDNYLLISANASPIGLLYGLSIFIFFKKIENKLKFNYIIYYISKYSFSIVLIHWFIISSITISRFSLRATNFKLIGIIPSTIVTIIAALIFSIIMDNTIILIINKIIELLHNKFIKK